MGSLLELSGALYGKSFDLHSMFKSARLPAVAVASFIAGLAVAGILMLFSCGPDMSLFVVLVVAILPPAYVYGTIARYDADLESRAPEFFYDLSEQVKASGSIIKALKRVSRHEYGAMSDEVLRVLSEVEHEGYDITSALEAMAVRINNRYISRSVSVISEALTTSSNLENILKVVAEEGRLSLSLKKEKRSGISSSVFVIYFTAIIFLGVTMLCLTSFMHMSGVLNAVTGVDGLPMKEMVMPYYVLSMSVALCTGLTIGEMRDSSVFGGFKDAAILLGLTFAIYELVIFPGYNLLGAYGL